MFSLSVSNRNHRVPLRMVGAILLGYLALGVLALAVLAYSKERYQANASEQASGALQLLQLFLVGRIERIDETLAARARELSGCEASRLLECVSSMAHSYPGGAGSLFHDTAILDEHGALIAGQTGYATGTAAEPVGLGGAPGVVTWRPVSSPHVLETEHDSWLLFSRPFLSADGSPGGRIVAGVSVAALRKLLPSLSLGPHGWLILGNGQDPWFGLNWRDGAWQPVRSPHRPPAPRDENLDGGAYRVDDRTVGVEHTLAHARLSDYRLAVTVGLSAEDYLAQWRRERDIVAFVMLVMLALSILSCWLLWHNHRLDGARQALRREVEGRMRLAASVFASTNESIVVTNAEKEIIDVNPAFTRITGYPRDEVIGRSPSMLRSGYHDELFYTEMWRAIHTTGCWRGEICDRRKSGELVQFLLSISTVADKHGGVQYYLGVLTDISNIKGYQQELERLANFDVLTGLPNRRLLLDRINQSISRAARNDTMMAVCYLDLDGFKPINDGAGHAAGDRVLVAVAERLQSVLRAGDTAARLGGDEFVLLLNDIANSDECSQILARVLDAVAQPIELDGRTLRVNASIGAAIYPLDDTEPDMLLRHADQAMYQAKESGRGRYQFFDQERDARARQRRRAINEIVLALENNEFELHYQPKVNLVDGGVIGFEALLRWRHPARGLLVPGEFLHAVSDSDYDISIGDWVIDTALRQLSRWSGVGLALPVSVNVSARQLQQGDFAERLRSALERYPEVPRAALTLEVLESSSLGDLDHAAKTLSACQALGVKIALDDFGTGYSSLTYFRRLPISQVKIDGSFVRDMLEDGSDRRIVNSIVRLAEAFDHEVVAEGVETSEHCDMLRSIGCTAAQGFGIARPMPNEQIVGWVRAWSGGNWMH